MAEDVLAVFQRRVDKKRRAKGAKGVFYPRIGHGLNHDWSVGEEAETFSLWGCD
jgi:hypothetical protein